jgi:serine/threonine protein kinase
MRLRGTTPSIQKVNDETAGSDAASLTAGSILDGRYELTHNTGGGGMATVYRATDLRLGRPVAIKVLHGHFANDPKALQRFQREAEFAAGLSAHPNIVSVYDVGREGALHYLVMEFVDGQTLKSLIAQRGKIPVEEALHIAREVAAALDFAHKYGFVHRDITPQNILITTDRVVKVTDFGIAHSVDASQLTKEGSVLGTAVYLAPEQARGKGSSPASDIYSLGIVLFEMLTGKPPFEADTAIATAMAHVQKKPPPPSSLNPNVPRWLDDVVLKALRKNANDRYASAAQFREAMVHRDLTARPESPISGQRRSPAGRSALIAARPEARPRRIQLPRRFGSLGVVIILVAAVSVIGAYAAYAAISNAVNGSSAQPPATSKHHHKTPAPTPTATPTPPSNPTIASGDVVLTPPDYFHYALSEIAPGSSMDITFYVTNNLTQSVHLVLVATLTGATGNTLTDSADNSLITAKAGASTVVRKFAVPANAAAGFYTLTCSLEDPATKQVYFSFPSNRGAIEIS